MRIDREVNGSNRYGKWSEGRFLNSRPRVAREVGLENRYGSLAHREFESLPLRHIFLAFRRLCTAAIASHARQGPGASGTGTWVGVGRVSRFRAVNRVRAVGWVGLHGHSAA